MTDNANIAVIGCGKVGRALGAWLSSKGYRVWFASRRRQSASEAAHEAGGGARSEPLSLLNIHLGRVLGNGTRIGFALTRGRSEP